MEGAPDVFFLRLCPVPIPPSNFPQIIPSTLLPWQYLCNFSKKCWIAGQSGGLDPHKGRPEIPAGHGHSTGNSSVLGRIFAKKLW